MASHPPAAESADGPTAASKKRKSAWHKPVDSDDVPKPETASAAGSGPATPPADSKNGDKEKPADAGQAPSSGNGKREPGASRVMADFREMEQAGRLSFSTIAPSWLISLGVHLALLLLFGMIVQREKISEGISDLIAAHSDEPQLDQQSLITPPETPQEIDDDSTTTEPVDAPIVSDTIVNEALAAPLEVSRVELGEIGLTVADDADFSAKVGTIEGMTGLAGRSEDAKRMMLAKGGGTEASEAAVARALKWLATHQASNGGWNFDHSRGSCQGQCKNPGGLSHRDQTVAATALGLLPFLGAGQTHREGQYKKNIERALYFLGSQIVVTANGGDLTQGDIGGTMYGHGLASIALCEAYGMSGDPTLRAPAQLALNYIMYAQDPKAGGWRYHAKEPGDTSVVGWQLMALKSGSMGKLQVNALTYKGASSFLDSVQEEGGSGYGYAEKGSAPTTTAVGLLCRMYLGWPKEQAALVRGVRSLSEFGPQPDNLYFDYYATQVLHHYGGDLWPKWNEKMREMLIEKQVKKGHAMGSWYSNDPIGSTEGGRLYCTAMATMILEVYYRHMPLYQEENSTSGIEESADSEVSQE